MTLKEIILKANEDIKSACKGFEAIYKEMELDPMLMENSNIAFGEIVKCIKHIALIQGDITGKELMPPEPTKTDEPLNS